MALMTQSDIQLEFSLNQHQIVLPDRSVSSQLLLFRELTVLYLNSFKSVRQLELVSTAVCLKIHGSVTLNRTGSIPENCKFVLIPPSLVQTCPSQDTRRRSFGNWPTDEYNSGFPERPLAGLQSKMALEHATQGVNYWCWSLLWVVSMLCALGINCSVSAIIEAVHYPQPFFLLLLLLFYVDTPVLLLEALFDWSIPLFSLKF